MNQYSTKDFQRFVPQIELNRPSKPTHRLWVYNLDFLAKSYIIYYLLNAEWRESVFIKRSANISRRMQKTKWKQCLRWSFKKPRPKCKSFFAYLVAIRKVMVTNAGHVINKIVTWSRKDLSWNIRSGGKKRVHISDGKMSCEIFVLPYFRGQLVYVDSPINNCTCCVHSHTFTVIHQTQPVFPPPWWKSCLQLFHQLTHTLLYW